MGGGGRGKAGVTDTVHPRWSLISPPRRSLAWPGRTKSAPSSVSPGLSKVPKGGKKPLEVCVSVYHLISTLP